MPMLNPASDVTTIELQLFKLSALVMTLIGVPIILGILWIVWRYRMREGHTGYDPSFDESAVINKVTFYVPLLTIVALGTLTWVYTHRLDPYRPRTDPAGLPPYEIQAIALDYKWLFIYPEAGVATVNELAAPAGRAVTIRISSDPMMTSLFIPSLVSQIYAMTGMETRANFLAAAPGEFEGANAMYSGPEFYMQRFKTRIMTQADFQGWLASVAAGTMPGATAAQEPLLDFARYRKLAERTPGAPVMAFTRVEPALFQTVLRQYEPAYRMNPLPVTIASSPAAAGAVAKPHKGH
ncbi:MAG: COX aromatic rich motif-containing protein [Proteobacteria bacterium]|nr:COX aromatic rich motif-containing protein [Pseudomonadota bacterium]